MSFLLKTMRDCACTTYFTLITSSTNFHQYYYCIHCNSSKTNEKLNTNKVFIAKILLNECKGFNIDPYEIKFQIPSF